jgi:hypothetical protein
MAYVTTGQTDETPTVVLVAGEDEVHLHHLTPDEARSLGVKLLEAAHKIEQPSTVWP